MLRRTQPGSTDARGRPGSRVRRRVARSTKVIRNYAALPGPRVSLNSGGHSWSANNGGNGAATTNSLQKVGGLTGDGMFQVKWTTGQTAASSSGPYYVCPNVVGGARYLVRVHLNPSIAGDYTVRLELWPTLTGGTRTAILTGPTTRCEADTWTPLVGVFDLAATTVRIVAAFNSTTQRSANELVRVSGMMVRQVPAEYTGNGSDVPHFDGNSPGAFWDGTPEVSTSSWLAPA